MDLVFLMSHGFGFSKDFILTEGLPEFYAALHPDLLQNRMCRVLSGISLSPIKVSLFVVILLGRSALSSMM